MTGKYQYRYRGGWFKQELSGQFTCTVQMMTDMFKCTLQRVAYKFICTVQIMAGNFICTVQFIVIVQIDEGLFIHMYSSSDRGRSVCMFTTDSYRPHYLCSVDSSKSVDMYSSVPAVCMFSRKLPESENLKNS